MNKPSGTRNATHDRTPFLKSNRGVASKLDDVCASYRKTANSGLTALRPNGTIRWCFDVQCSASGGLAMGTDSAIYVGGRNHSLWAVTGEGVEKWHFGTPSLVLRTSSTPRKSPGACASLSASAT